MYTYISVLFLILFLYEVVMGSKYSSYNFLRRKFYSNDERESGTIPSMTYTFAGWAVVGTMFLSLSATILGDR